MVASASSIDRGASRGSDEARPRLPGASGSGSDYHPDLGFFEDLARPFGASTLDLRVASLSARLTGLSPRQQAELAARYGVFARRRSGEAPVDLEVAVRRSPRPGFLTVGRAPEYYRLLTRREGEALLAWSYEWAAAYKLGAGRAVLAAASDERVVFDRIVENFLRVGFAHLALEKGGVLLHAAGIVRGGRAYAFFGPSGSGKTTVSTLSAGDLVLSDDLLLIAAGEDGYRAWSVPFRGLMTPPAVSDASHPLAGLFRLVQDSTHAVESPSRSQAVGELVQSLPFVTDRPEAASRILDVAGRIAATVPVRRLRFAKDPGFWRVIEGVGGSAAQAS